MSIELSRLLLLDESSPHAWLELPSFQQRASKEPAKLEEGSSEAAQQLLFAED